MAIPTWQEIEETLSLMDNWEDRYGFIIDLGRALPPMDDALKTDALLVPGCTSKVWLLPAWDGLRLHLQMDSDASIVKGLLAILYALYHDKTGDEIASVDLNARFTRLGLDGQLSPNRRNGFFAVADRIQKLGHIESHGDARASGRPAIG